MRALLIFLLCVVPSTALLAWLDRRNERRAPLPEEGPPADEPALLLGSDLSDPYGQSPFSGSVRRLEGFELRIVESGYFKLYLRIERLGRHDDRPRLEDVRVAVFDPPKEGKPNLRLTLRAPFVRGDPRELLHAPEGAPRIVTLGGGVEAFDAKGRPLAELERLAIDATGKTVAADVPVALRLPERGAEARAQGLTADLGLRTARLKGPVTASISTSRGTIALRATGDATVEEAAEGGEIRVSIEGDVEIEQAGGRASCRRIDAVFSRAEGEVNLRKATLSGGVRLELAPGAARGIEAIEMPALAIEGTDRISSEGPVLATWRGHLPKALAIGERTVRIAAGAVSFRLGRAEDGTVLLADASFEGFRAEDADGAGSLSGRTLRYAPAHGRLDIEGDVAASTPAGSLAAALLRVEAPSPGDGYDLFVEGEKRIVYKGEIGALGGGVGSELRLSAKGPLRLAARGDTITCSAEREVVATTDGGASLRSDALGVVLTQGKLVSFAASGGVVLVEPARGAEISGRSLAFDGTSATVEGAPAAISTKDGRSARAQRITWREDGTFALAGGVDVDALLEGNARWRLACDEARGAVRGGGTPAAMEATGGVRATGPAGEEILGDSLLYDGAKGFATLLGEPARLRRGDEITLVAPKGLTLRVEEGRVVEGSSLGPSTIDYRPAKTEGERAGDFRRFVAVLNGPARLEGDRLVVALGATLRGSDGEKDVLVAEAKRVEILLDASGKTPTVRRIVGDRGVRVESRGKEAAVVTADRLSFVPGTREVRVAGGAQVAAAGWPRDVRFREIVFLLTKDGMDLKSASDVEVR